MFLRHLKQPYHAFHHVCSTPHQVFEGIRFICELMTAALQSGNMASIEDVTYEVPELLGLLRDQLVRLFYDTTFDDWERRVCKNVLNCILDVSGRTREGQMAPRLGVVSDCKKGAHSSGR